MLQGGLGNQLFQFAAGWLLAKNNSRTLVLDSSLIAQTSKHGESFTSIRPDWLKSENVKIEIPSTRKFTFGLNTRIRTSSKYSGIMGKRVITDELFQQIEADSAGDLNLNNAVKFNELILLGMFQDWRIAHFAKKEGLLFDFSSRISNNTKLKKLHTRIEDVNCVGISIRLGNDVIYSRKHAQPSINYFRRAIEYSINIQETSSFIIFTDNPMRSKTFLMQLPCKLRSKLDFLDSQGTLTSAEKLFLLAESCSGVIATNSTFCHWAAWIASSNGKICISPIIKDSNLPYLTGRPTTWHELEIT